MPKLKTNRGAKKRFAKRGKGFKRGQAVKRHILTKKSGKRVRNLRGPASVHPSDVAEVAQMLPYA
ncbi:MAG TPA: 50S ribosomal protein L35 [Candidatus Binatia bacterium]|nr:50S ribosomal protein L35 [Candidatus Binatia bacterium]